MIVNALIRFNFIHFIVIACNIKFTSYGRIFLIQFGSPFKGRMRGLDVDEDAFIIFSMLSSLYERCDSNDACVFKVFPTGGVSDLRRIDWIGFPAEFKIGVF